MISLKKRNITVLTDDELSLVSGGWDTEDTRGQPWQPTDDCTDPGYSTADHSCVCTINSD
ncbi:hypothetical protein YH67_05250 [Stenotrophomonas maltophilia]|nr:hypothetical protein YH67_05250 [Stenotrophomonas maltophilia]ALA89655.1 hypothetical protein YH68_05250 [Stenotrophomonas maltophilia]